MHPLLQSFINSVMKSWQTSLVGIAGVPALFVQINALTDNDPNTVADMSQLAVAAGLVVLSLLARANSVSSEDAGAK